MTRLYKSYSEAAKHRKRDEMTIMDIFTGKYKNVKIFQPIPTWRRRF